MDENDVIVVEKVIEAMLFAASNPLSLGEIEKRLPRGAPIREAIENLQNRYEDRGVNLKKIGENYAFRTSSAMEHYLRSETNSERKLSRAAIETLAIIAYHQPTTRAEIEEIRGVAVSKGTLDQLLSLEWIRLGKRRETPGRPITFLTTLTFLDHFGLSSSKDLPGIAELRSAGILNRSPLEEETDTATPEQDFEEDDLDEDDLDEDDMIIEDDF